MDEKPVDHPGVPGEQYHTLGTKTLWVFILTRIHTSFVILLLDIVLFALTKQPFVATSPIKDLPILLSAAAGVLFFVFVFAFAITFLVSWLIYVNYKFFLGDNALKIKRGIFTKEEISIPYRQIQDINLRRDLSFQMMGLSRVIILTAGHEDEKPEDSESEGIFPALDKDLAEWLQTELLKRANVQKVVETTG